MKKSPKVVLVAGAQGVIGRAAAEHFAKEAGTTVYGVSRRSIEGLENVTAISADLFDPVETGKSLGSLKDVTHVVFGAYVERETPAEPSLANVALLRNLMDQSKRQRQTFGTSPFTKAARPTARIWGRSKPPPARTIPA